MKADGDMLADFGASDIGELLGRGGWAERADAVTVSTIVRLSPGVAEIEGLGCLENRVAKERSL